MFVCRNDKGHNKYLEKTCTDILVGDIHISQANIVTILLALLVYIGAG